MGDEFAALPRLGPYWVAGCDGGGDTPETSSRTLAPSSSLFSGLSTVATVGLATCRASGGSRRQDDSGSPAFSIALLFFTSFSTLLATDGSAHAGGAAPRGTWAADAVTGASASAGGAAVGALPAAADRPAVFVRSRRHPSTRGRDHRRWASSSSASLRVCARPPWRLGHCHWHPKTRAAQRASVPPACHAPGTGTHRMRKIALVEQSERADEPRTAPRSVGRSRAGCTSRHTSELAVSAYAPTAARPRDARRPRPLPSRASQCDSVDWAKCTRMACS
jgi:hypothetical protein